MMIRNCKKHIDFTIPYHHEKLAILVKADSKISKISDLKSARVMAFEHTTGYKYLKDNSITQNIYPTVGEEYAPDFHLAILHDKVDAFILDESYLKGIITKDSRFKLVMSGIVSEPWGIGVKKGSKELINKLNQAIQKNLDNGKIRRVFEKYGY